MTTDGQNREPASHPVTEAGRGPMPPLTFRAWLRYDVVSRLVKEFAPDSILEFGSGQGGFGARLAARARYVGGEPDLQAATVAAQRVGSHGGVIVNGDETAVGAG